MAAEQMVAGRFQIKRLIGRGGFGQVYEALDTVRGDRAAVKKMETWREGGKCFGFLWRESRFYRKLAGERICVPNLRYFGTEENCNVLVLDLMGPSLGKLFSLCGCRFSLKTVLGIGIQTVQGLEHLHKLGIIHRDVKPDNFVMGLGRNAHKVYLIDFGLAVEYCTPTGRHAPFREGIGEIGTLLYLSVNVHRKRLASRRDDLESLAYVLIEFLKQALPWRGLQASTSKKKKALVGKMKMDICVRELCQGCPKEFAQFLEHCRELEYEQQPNYQFLKGLFANLFREKGYQQDKVFDWTHKLIGNACTAGGTQEKKSEEGTGRGNANALLEVEHQPQFYVTRHGRQIKPPGRLVQEI